MILFLHLSYDIEYSFKACRSCYLSMRDNSLGFIVLKLIPILLTSFCSQVCLLCRIHHCHRYSFVHNRLHIYDIWYLVFATFEFV